MDLTLTIGGGNLREILSRGVTGEGREKGGFLALRGVTACGVLIC